MKIQKFVPILLASALLASCKTPTPVVSSSVPSNEQPASSVLPSEESTTPVSSEEASASSEETSVSSEASSSSEATTPSSSSEEPVTPPASSSEEPTPAVVSSWEQITEGAKGQINEFFQYFDPESEAHKPDDYLPVLPVATSVEWTYDGSYNPGRGVSVGLIALTGSDTNENKALIAQYNQSILAKGWKKATDEELTNYSDAYCPIYGKNVYNFDDPASGALLLAEIIPCADAEGDGMNTFDPVDANGNTVTTGILFVIQVYETL